MNLPNSKEKYKESILTPWRYWVMMVAKLPSIAFWGARIAALDDNKCVIALPYRYSTKNPFKSIYFSALNGAAEISTGFLVHMYVAEYGSHSMLVTKFSAEFYKKSDTTIHFSCDQGEEVAIFFENLKKNSGTGIFVLTSNGRNTAGEEVCRMEVTWSIKRRN
jgi:hypothetical protein